MTVATKELPTKAFKLTNGRMQDNEIQLYNGNATATASCEVKGLVSFRWGMSNDEPLPVMRIKGKEINLPPPPPTSSGANTYSTSPTQAG